MKKCIPYIACSFAMILNAQAHSENNNLPAPPEATPQNISAQEKSLVQRLEPFTGKVTRNRVRLRVQPHLDAPILKELQRDDCLVINGIADDFYAVQPPQHMKGYVYRTYILDDHIEGNNVNVRLEPDTTSPVVMQLNAGDKVNGMISPINSKWYEIALPESVCFFVAKEFVNKVGDAHVYEDIEKRKNTLDSQFLQIDGAMSEEFKKPFKEIQLAPLAAQLHQIMNYNQDLPPYVERAQSMLQKMQEAYLQKSMSSQQANFPAPEAAHPQETALANEKVVDHVPVSQSAPDTDTAPFKQMEHRRVQAAIDSGRAQTAKDFYALEAKKGLRMKGVVKPFMRNVRNAPGDFVLVNPQTQVVAAFLFSTSINLLDYANKEVTVLCVERPNNDYAFPAYFVISVEK